MQSVQVNIHRILSTRRKSDKEHFEIIVDKNVKPRFCTLGRIPLFQCDKIEEFVTLFLKLGIIEPSNSPSAARSLLIKKGNSFRFCVNYVPLNE